jgi:hypothetical protein
MERPNRGHKWSEILATIGMKGVSQLNEDEKKSIMLEYEEERAKRVNEFQMKRATMKEIELRRAIESQKMRIEHEDKLRETLEEEKVQRVARMKEWLLKVKREEAAKARAKEDLKRLAESELAKSTSRLASKSVMASMRIPGPKEVAVGIRDEPKSKRSLQARSQSPRSSSRSALVEYMKLSSVSSYEGNNEKARYREIMRDSNYAQNVKLASTIYSRKLNI